MAYKQIGETLEFTNQQGQQCTGEIIGRDWAYSILLFYTVRTPDGKRYNVNVDTLVSGHSY